MRYIVLFFSFLILLSSCKDTKVKEKAAEGEYLIKGEIENIDDSKVYLETIRKQDWEVVDSADIVDGSFSFSGSVPTPDFYLLRFNNNETVMLILENKEIEFSGDANDLINSVKVVGSKPTNEYIDFNRKFLGLDSIEKSYNSKLLELYEGGNKEAIHKMEAAITGIEEYKNSFVKSYVDSIIPSIAIYNMVNYLDPETDLEYLLGLSERLKKEMPDTRYTKLFSEEISRLHEYKTAKQEKEVKSVVGVGKQAPDISLPGPDGKIIKLSSLKGKYVLLDFWASWCGPCRAENPHVVKLYNRYKASGKFEILGVSLDRDKPSWVKAIQADKLQWKHVSDLKHWDSEVVPVYEIEGIPATYLLDKEGKIIAKNLRGKALDDKLKEVLK